MSNGTIQSAIEKPRIHGEIFSPPADDAFYQVKENKKGKNHD